MQELTNRQVCQVPTTPYGVLVISPAAQESRQIKDDEVLGGEGVAVLGRRGWGANNLLLGQANRGRACVKADSLLIGDIFVRCGSL